MKLRIEPNAQLSSRVLLQGLWEASVNEYMDNLDIDHDDPKVGDMWAELRFTPFNHRDDHGQMVVDMYNLGVWNDDGNRAWVFEASKKACDEATRYLVDEVNEQLKTQGDEFRIVQPETDMRFYTGSIDTEQLFPVWNSLTRQDEAPYISVPTMEAVWVSVVDDKGNEYEFKNEKEEDYALTVINDTFNQIFLDKQHDCVCVDAFDYANVPNPAVVQANTVPLFPEPKFEPSPSSSLTF